MWWARPRKLCALERPGGRVRSHRTERREAEIEYLKASGVRLVVSCMETRHNLTRYEAAGLAWEHVPVESTEEGAERLDELLTLLRRELRRPGAVAIHANRYTDFVAAVCAAHLHEWRGIDPELGLGFSSHASEELTCSQPVVFGVRVPGFLARSRMAAST
jgi:hypothetical protein